MNLRYLITSGLLLAATSVLAQPATGGQGSGLTSQQISFMKIFDAGGLMMYPLAFISMVGVGQMIVSAALMLWYDAVLFLIVAGMVPVLWSLNRYFRRRLSDESRIVQESFSRLTSTMAESISGIRVTQGFVRQDVNAGIFRRLVLDHSRYNVNLARTGATLLPLLELNNQFFSCSGHHLVSCN